MKILIAEDDFASRVLLQELLKPYGAVHVAANGEEAAKAAIQALEANELYDLICLDIMMPEKDGHAALKEIREAEEAKGIFSNKGSKIIMTTALNDFKNVHGAYSELCDGYLVKPVENNNLIQELKKLNLIDNES